MYIVHVVQLYNMSRYFGHEVLLFFVLSCSSLVIEMHVSLPDNSTERPINTEGPVVTDRPYEAVTISTEAPRMTTTQKAESLLGAASALHVSVTSLLMVLVAALGLL